MPDRDEESAVASTDPVRVRHAAMDLLARREHSIQELQMKLQRRFPDRETVHAEIHRLARENLQSDQRFAAGFVRQRAGRGYGPLRIRQEMRERGLDDATIGAAFDEPGLDWHDLAATVFRKKFGEPTAVATREKARRVRFMQYRGFGPDHCRHLIDP
jgi:regulatory protein